MSQNGFDSYKIAEFFRLKDGREGCFVRDKKTDELSHAFLEGTLVHKKDLSILFGEIMKNLPDDFIVSRQILHDLKKVAPILKRLDEDMERLNSNTESLKEDIALVKKIIDEAFLREIENLRNGDGGDEKKAKKKRS